MKLKVSPDKIFWIIYLSLLAFIFLTFRDYGTSWDEKFHLDRGKAALETFFDPYKVSDAGRDVYAVPEGIFFAMLYALPFKVFSQEENYEALHLVKALVGSLSLIFVYLSLRAIKKDWSMIIAPILLIFSPRWLGDLFDNHNDIVATLLYSIEMFLAIKILMRNTTRGGWIWIAALAVFSGLAFEHRPGLVMVTAITMTLLSWVYFKKSFLILTVFTAAFLATLFAVDPYIAAHPLSGIPLKAKFSIAPIAENFRVFYEGKIIYALNLPRDYLPKFIAITTPLIILILVTFGTGFMLITAVKEKALNLKAIYILILASLYLPIATIIIVNPMNFDAWRHLLFLVIPMCMIAGFGFTSLLSKVRPKFRWVPLGLLVITLGLVAKEYILLHPYEYVYFNELVGGLKGAKDRFEIDYWGKSTKEATIWLENNLAADPGKEYTVATCVSTFQSEYYFTPNIYSVDYEEADFYICPREVSDQLPDKKPIHSITRKGVPLNHIK